MTAETIAEIARELRACMVVPPERRLWDMACIADYSGFSVSTVQQRIVCLPDFPAAIQAVDGGQPRWIAAEVMEWFEGRRVTRAARRSRPPKD